MFQQQQQKHEKNKYRYIAGTVEAGYKFKNVLWTMNTKTTIQKKKKKKKVAEQNTGVAEKENSL